MKPYAYEVTDKRGKKYLVFADSVAHNNAVMFGYRLKPLYEGESPHAYQTEYAIGRIHSQSGALSCKSYC